VSFRQNNQSNNKWKSWSLQHRDELIACNVPLMVVENEQHWLYFLDHGYFTPVNGTEPVLNIDRMDKKDALRLCVFLELDDFYPGSATLNRLQYLLARGKHSEKSS
jgi:hypothetical protein